MKRMKFLFGQRRMQVLLTLAVLLLAASVVIGSGANFTSTSANPGNVFTAGTLHIGNYLADGTTDNEDQAVASLSVTSKMKPGDHPSGIAVIKNEGDLDGTFTLSQAVVKDTAPNGGALSGLLTVKITQTILPSGPTTVIRDHTDGTLATMLPLSLGVFPAGQARQYTIEVKWPNGASAVDNLRKGAEMDVDFTWDAVQ